MRIEIRKIVYLLGMCFCIIFGKSVYATEMIAIDEQSFPDEKFREYVSLENIDLDQDGYLSKEERESVTTMNLLHVVNATGLEHFPNLIKVFFKYDLENVDFFRNTKIKELVFNYCPMESLDVSALVDLEYLNTIYCDVKEIDLTHNYNLVDLKMQYNQLKEIDLSQNTKLTTILLANNQLEKIDLSNNVNLEYVRVDNNQLNTLIVENNISLTSLYCYNNQLDTLIVGNNIPLSVLDCHNNQLDILIVGNNVPLSVLDCSYNQFTTLDLSGMTNLHNINARYNPLRKVIFPEYQGKVDFGYCQLVAVDTSDCKFFKNEGSTYYTIANFKVTNNCLPVQVGSNCKIYYENLIGFQSSKVESMTGGICEEGYILWDGVSETIEYVYDIGNDATRTFSIQPTIDETQEDIKDNGLSYIENDNDVNNEDEKNDEGDGTAEDDETGEGDGTVEDGETGEGDGTVEDGEIEEGDGTIEDGGTGEDNGTVEDGETEEGDGTAEDDETEEGDGTVEDGETGEGDGTVEDGETGEGDGTVEDGEIGEGDGTVEDGETGEGDGTVEDGETGEGDGTVEDGETEEGDGTAEDDETGEDNGTVEDDETREGDGTVEDGETEEDNGTVEDDEIEEGDGIVEDNETEENDGTVEDGECDENNGINDNTGDDSLENGESDTTENGGLAEDTQVIPIQMTTVISIPVQIYCGQGITPLPTLSYNGMSLVVNRDYTLTYQNNVNVGTAQVIIHGSGNYKGTKIINFDIVPFDASKLSTTLKGKDGQIYRATYTKKVIKLKTAFKIATTNNGKKVYLQPKEGTDYSVRFKNNKKIGTASIIYTFKGNYTGTLVKNFQIVPPATKVVSVKKSGLEVVIKWRKVSSCDRYEVYCATSKNGKYKKIATVKGKNKCIYKDKKAKKGKKYYYKVKACKKVKGKIYKSDFSNVKKGKR